MALETGTYISSLDITNPTSSDPKSQGDDHIKLIKATIKASFPNVSGAVSATHTELSYVDGVTSAIQTQIDTKGAHAGQVWTGVQNFTGSTITVPTPASGSAPVTRDYMDAVVIAAGNLPDPAAHSGELLSSDGVDGAWVTEINTTVMKLANGADPTKLVAFDLSGMTTGTTKTLLFNDNSFNFTDPADPTKKAYIVASGITAGQNRSITIRDRNIVLTTPGTEWLQTVSASASSTVDITGFDNATFDAYIITLSNVRLSVNNADLLLQMKVNGTLQTSQYYGHVESSGSAAATYTGAVTSSGASLIVADDLGTDATTGGCDMTLWINGASNTAKHHKLNWEGEILTGTGGTTAVKRAGGIGGCGAAIGALTEIRFLPTSGNIVLGDFKLYGIRAV